MTGQRDLVLEVLEALADADRVAPTELEYTLHDYVDPEVLVALADVDTRWQFSFQVETHEVTITSDGRLFVDGVLCRFDLPVSGRSASG